MRVAIVVIPISCFSSLLYVFGVPQEYHTLLLVLLLKNVISSADVIVASGFTFFLF